VHFGGSLASDKALVSVKPVVVHRARLVLGQVTVFGRINRLGM